MYPASLPSLHLFLLASSSKSGTELPSGAQVCFALCIIVGIHCNADGCAVDRTSCHQCGTLCASCTSLQIHHHSYQIPCKNLCICLWIIAYLQTLHQHPHGVSMELSFLINVHLTISVKINWRSFALSFWVMTSDGMDIWCCPWSPSSSIYSPLALLTVTW